MSDRRPLSPDEIARLKKYHALGLTDTQLAEVMELDLSRLIGQRAWLGLAANGSAKLVPLKEPPPPRDTSNPIQVAENWLGSRFVRKDDVLMLDGIPRKADYIVREANRLLVEAGLEQVGPEHWRI